jgi:hypothetical protein
LHGIGTMIHLSFRGLLGPPAVIGPAPYFVIEGRYVRSGPGREIVARHEHLQWDVGGRSFSGWECAEPTRIRFENEREDRPQDLGPFTDVRFSDGHCWADDKRVAQLDEDRGVWTLLEDGTEWRLLFLLPDPES